MKKYRDLIKALQIAADAIDDLKGDMLFGTIDEFIDEEVLNEAPLKQAQWFHLKSITELETAYYTALLAVTSAEEAAEKERAKWLQEMAG